MKFNILLLFVLLSHNLTGEELKSIFDFAPPPEIEMPLINLLSEDFNNKAGLVVSAGSTAAFLGLTIYNSYQIAEQALSNRTGEELQKRIVLTGTFFVSTAITVVFMDYFIEELKKQNNSISEE